jgi:hypothetical protein
LWWQPHPPENGPNNNLLQNPLTRNAMGSTLSKVKKRTARSVNARLPKPKSTGGRTEPVAQPASQRNALSDAQRRSKAIESGDVKRIREEGDRAFRLRCFREALDMYTEALDVRISCFTFDCYNVASSHTQRGLERLQRQVRAARFMPEFC